MSPASQCAHRVHVRARRVSAIVHQGHLLGHESLERNDRLRRLQPESYEVLEYCQSPVCEKVFKAEKQQEAA